MTKNAVAKVLELKGFAREQLEAEIRKIRDKLREEEARLAGLEQSFRDASNEFASRPAVTVQEVELYSQYGSHLTKLIKQQKEIVALRSNEVKAVEQELMKAYREQKMVQILHDRIEQQEQKDHRAGEQKESDERSVMRRTQS